MSIDMKTYIRVLAFLSFSSAMAQAEVIASFSDFLIAADPTQTGRLSRNGIPQDWSGDELFPGVINTTTTYHYQTYAVNVGNTPYIQIDVDSLSTVTFVAAYDGTFVPDSGGSPNYGFDVNWLGDAGTSGNYFGTDPISFQVLLASFDNLIIVVGQTGAGTTGLGAGNPYNITVEGFIDSEYDDPASTPEPAAGVLSVAGLLMLSLAGFIRKLVPLSVKAQRR